MSQVKPVTMSQVVSARMHNKNLPVIGQIMVPSVGLHLPIGKGIDNQTLMLAAGTMKAQEKMGQGNYSLAGHHMINKSALFTPLYFHAHKGTRVYLTDMKKMYVYKINVRKIISPYDLNVIHNTRQPILTLITCNDSGSKRLLLQG
ncbi:MAG: class A sortase [Acetilactobacillus jinshanensis]